TSRTMYPLRLISGSNVMRSATSKPRPQKSMMYPLVRSFGAFSTMVGVNPYRASRYASVAPAIPAPDIRTLMMRAYIGCCGPRWLRSYSKHDSQASVAPGRSEEHTSELHSLAYLVCRLL